MIFRIVAAAYAENGQFSQAIESAHRGAQLANAQGNTALSSELQSNIVLYESGRPLRDPTLTDSSLLPSRE